MNEAPVLILGGGPAGLCLSLFLRDRGIQSQIIEKSERAGGLARSFKMGPYTFDHSGHLLHTTNPDILRLVRSRLRVKLNRIERNSVCWTDGTYIPFPYQRYLSHLPARRVREALVQFFKRRVKSPKNFREWIHASYGDGVGRQFLYPYNLKLWNTPLTRMSADWVPRFIPNSGSQEMLRSAFGSPQDPWGYNAVFYYPSIGGIGTIADRLAATVSERTTLGARIDRIDLTRRIVHLQDHTSWKYENLVSTIPLPDFLRLAGMKSTPMLRSTGVTVFNVGLNSPFPHDFHWCYVPQKNIPFYRFGVYSNISRHAAPANHSSLYVECAARPDRLGQFKFSDVLRYMIRLKLLRRPAAVDVVQRLDIKYAYPVPLVGLSSYRRRLQTHLNRKGVELIGRFGAWSYTSISDAVTEALNLSKKLSRDRSLRGR